AHLHAARVVLDRRVEEALDTGKGHDLVEAALDFLPAHAENRPIHEDVLAPGQLGMKPCTGLEKGPDTAADEGTPPRRLGDARQDLEQRALPRTVPAHDADDITLADLERQVVERPDPGRLGAVSTPEGRPQQLPDPVAQHAIR